MKAIKSILSKSLKNNNDKLNILTHPTHEGYETNLAKTNHIFWGYQDQGIKDWKECYRPLPSNYILLPPKYLPDHQDFDVILCQNIAHWKYFKNFQQLYHLPMIRLEHCFATFHPEQIKQMKSIQGDITIFISEISRSQWGFSEKEAHVIRHGIDHTFFCANPNIDRKQSILSINNDFVNRGHLLGFNIWQEVTRDLQNTLVGDTKGLSVSAKSVFELKEIYQKHSIFLNTSLISPIPSVLLEAAACECCIVSTNNSLIPEIFTHEYDSYLSNDPKELRKFAQFLLDNPAECRRIGANARKTVMEKCNLDRFVNDWQTVFNQTRKMVYRG